jgi:hypothetical protein
MLQLPYMSAAQGGGMAGVAWEVAGDVLRFPLWWYGEGLRQTLLSIFGVVRGYARSLGVFVWMKNLFTPMFGRYDWQSRLISVFMRAVNIFGRGFAVIVIAMIGVLACVAYLALPIVAATFVLYHATAFFSV